MAVLAVSTYAARCDLAAAMRAAGVDVALLDAYDEVRQYDSERGDRPGEALRSPVSPDRGVTAWSGVAS